MRPSTILVWRGLSTYNDEPIEVTLTGLRRRSSNIKTNDMAQVWIQASASEPHVAALNGDELAACGSCPLTCGRGCYVVRHQAPLAVHRWARRHNAKPNLLGACEAIATVSKPTRFGAFGDVGYLPRNVSEPLLSSAQHKGWTCYSQTWRDPENAWLSRYAMASCYGRTEAAVARSLGWLPFVVTADSDPVKGCRPCPTMRGASCDRCLGCSGTEGGRGHGFYLPAHGASAAKVRRLVVLTESL